MALTNKKLLLPLQWRIKQNFICDFEKLINYLASSLIIVWFNSCVDPSPRNKIFVFLLSICIEELLLTSKITFLPQSKTGFEKVKRGSNPIPNRNVYQDQHFWLI